MPVMDEFKEERAALKNAGFKEKWQYFLDYYKWYVIGGGLAIFFLCIFVRDILSAKDYALFGTFLNAYAYENEDGTIKGQALMDEMATRLEIDTEKYVVDIDNSLSIGSSSSMDVTGMTASEVSYNSEQKLMVFIAAGDLDFIAADSTTFLRYATTETFHDLRNILTPEQLEKYEPYFYYVDMDEVAKANEAAQNLEADSYVGRVYDPLDPSTCVDPVPIAICINNSDKAMEAYWFREEVVPMGFVVNSTHVEDAVMFLDYLFE
ncbi:MAG: hypothetical protein IJZ82_10970 [Lachnospiraceae bacterium]|nr:hypothetical protein [Lachnospiraceae bacterium]